MLLQKVSQTNTRILLMEAGDPGESVGPGEGGMPTAIGWSQQVSQVSCGAWSLW